MMPCHLFLFGVTEKNGFYIVRGWRKIKRIIFYDTCNLYEIWTSVYLKDAILDFSHVHLPVAVVTLPRQCGVVVTETVRLTTPTEAALLPLQKTFSEPWFRWWDCSSGLLEPPMRMKCTNSHNIMRRVPGVQ